MCRYIASARGRELSGRVRADAYNFAVLYSGSTGALRIKARDIVMAGLNARGLQSKLLITPLSSEAIIMNIQISLKFHAVCAASKVLQNYNDLGLKELYSYVYNIIIFTLIKLSYSHNKYIKALVLNLHMSHQLKYITDIMKCKPSAQFD